MSRAPKILVVDDNAENRALAQAVLDDEDYDVVLAASGAEGIQQFEQQRPDCILLDIRMPGMDGFAVCTKLRELEGGADTPILFLTALRDLETFDRALLAGCDDFLTKPFRPTELITRVQAALKLRRVSAELREQYELVRKQRDDLMRLQLQLQKERLSAFVVHDLKSPVSSIDLGAQLLARDASLPSHARETAERIRDSSRTLLRLILNLLDISRSEEGKLTAKRVRVDLGELSGKLLETHAVSAQERDVTVKLDAASAFADADLLQRVLENLLDNAIRHAPAGSHVSLLTARTDAAVEIRVSDEGAGIPAALRDRIFDPFVQAPAIDRPVTRSGPGLGLAFCKLAVEAHGGAIRVEDAIKGTTICLSLPDER